MLKHKFNIELNYNIRHTETYYSFIEEGKI